MRARSRRPPRRRSRATSASRSARAGGGGRWGIHRSPTPTWSARCASSPSSAGAIRAGTRWWRSAARGRCMPPARPCAGDAPRDRSPRRRRRLGTRPAAWPTRRSTQGMTRVLRLNEAAPETLADIFARLEERVAAEVRRMDRGGALRLQRECLHALCGTGLRDSRRPARRPCRAGLHRAPPSRAFHAAYQREYGYNDPTAAVEVERLVRSRHHRRQPSRRGLPLRQATTRPATPS